MRPRPLKLIVGEPIPTAGLTTRDAERLTEELYAIIHRTYTEANDSECKPLPRRPSAA